ncbi:MAG: hypothetical protein L0215_03590 [Gemmataceae bacterium]|nr:hypothetical protein [Gemmataceae bacterium]
MYEPLLQRIHGLERANRRWKLLCGILAAALVALLASGTVFVGLYGWHGIAAHQEAQRAMDVARQQEMLAKQQAEVALQAAQALQNAQRQAKKE